RRGAVSVRAPGGLPGDRGRRRGPQDRGGQGGGGGGGDRQGEREAVAGDRGGGARRGRCRLRRQRARDAAPELPPPGAGRAPDCEWLLHHASEDRWQGDQVEARAELLADAVVPAAGAVESQSRGVWMQLVVHVPQRGATAR